MKVAVNGNYLADRMEFTSRTCAVAEAIKDSFDRKQSDAQLHVRPGNMEESEPGEPESPGGFLAGAALWQMQ